MFWIIETQKQLKALFSKTYSEIFIEVITGSDDYHPALTEPLCVFINIIETNKSYIIPINHSEGLNEIPFDLILQYLVSMETKIYVYDKKHILYYLNRDVPVFCLKTAYMLSQHEIITSKTFNTKSHSYFYNRYFGKENINTIIPLSKHFEKWSNFISSIKFDKLDFSGKTYEFYNKTVIESFFEVEKNGIGINDEIFDQNLHPRHKIASVRESKVYSEYNIFHNTVRPSNIFNNVNLAALKKNSGERECLVPINDIFIELDYNSLHPRLLGELIDYNFEGDVYNHLGEGLMGEEYDVDAHRDPIKAIVFKILYGKLEDKEYRSNEYFDDIISLRKFLWEKYNEKGYIKSPITGRKMIGIDSETKILPYLCQCLETEKNSVSLQSINNLLIGKKTKLVLYTYDSFLLDYAKEDGKELLEKIVNVLEYPSGDYFYPLNIKYGKNYNNLTKAN